MRSRWIEKFAGVGLVLLALGVVGVVALQQLGDPSPPREEDEAAHRSSEALSEEPSFDGPTLSPATSRDARELCLRTVKAADSTPVAGADCIVFFVPDPSAPRRLLWHGATDADGVAIVRVDRLPVEIIAKRSGMLGTSCVLTEAELQKGEVVLPLKTLARLVLTVVDAQGARVPETLVRISYHPSASELIRLMSSGEYPSRRRVDVTVDDEGMARVKGIMPGVPLGIRAVAPSCGIAELELDPLDPGETRDSRVRLEPRAGLRLRVIDPYGVPLAGARVLTYHVAGSDLQGSTSRVTDDTGVLHLQGLPEGGLRIAISGWNASGADLYLINRETEVRAGEVRDLGDIQAGGAPAEFMITLPEPEAENAASRLTTAHLQPMDLRADGAPGSTHETTLPVARRFRIWGLEPGSWSFMGMLTEAGSRVFDSSFKPLVTTIAMPPPGLTSLVFERRPKGKAHDGKVHLTVAMKWVSTAKGKLRVLLLRGAEIVVVLDGVFAKRDFRYLFGNLADGEYRVVALDEARYGEAAFSVQEGSEERVELRLDEEPVFLRAGLRWSTNGEYVQDAVVGVVAASDWDPTTLGGRRLWAARTTDNGMLRTILVPGLPSVLHVSTRDGRHGMVEVPAARAGSVLGAELDVVEIQ